MLQWLKHSWLRARRKVSGRCPSRNRQAGKSSFRPQLDPLEERCLLTAGVLSTFYLDSTTHLISVGPDADGNLWFTGVWTSSGQGIGRITPTGEITVFSGPGVPGGSITAGPDGNLWIMGGDVIGRLTPNGVLTEFSVPEAIASPAAIALEG